MAEEKISKEMPIGDVVAKKPAAAEIMLKHGLHCIGCHVASFETLEQGAKSHGMNDKELEEMVAEINSAREEKE